MSDTALPALRISGSVFRRWSEVLGPGLMTIFPGLVADTAPLTEWFELWIETWERRPQRGGSPELCDVRITAHAFVRPSDHPARIQVLAELARTALDGQTLAVVDPELSGRPVLGYLKLGLADSRDLTRLDRDAGAHGLHHQLLVWHGLAQRVFEA